MRRKQIIRKIQSSFKCQRCNECCRQPGFVYLNAKDTPRIARFLNLEYEAFIAKHCTTNDGNRVLKANDDGSCIFLNDEGCSINEVKPKQCVDYPFKWRDEASFDYCEGIQLLIKESFNKKTADSSQRISAEADS